MTDFLSYNQIMNKTFILSFLIAVLVVGGGVLYYLKYKDLSEGPELPVIIEAPKAGSEISNPLSFSGKARGIWFFEASFPVRVYDDAGIELGVGIAQAKGDWMTKDFVEFSGQVNFKAPSTDAGKVVFEKDNPSGLEENAGFVEVPIRFKSSALQTMNVKAFFSNRLSDPKSVDCQKVYAVTRTIPKTLGVAVSAISELLAGPTVEESRLAYFTSIPVGAALKTIYIQDGVAYADFSAGLVKDVAGSCRVLAMQAQIRETLKQFPTIKEVVILVEGQENAIQP